ncbi:YihY/virulence factor BrkB family protein [Mesorhizobium microcysteis]|uniref:YihY/virulence factor BrkB family protein n=1 Tax=Neoaquamicrobium microcysteis TaxID=2682781 RepID=A0A5D4H4L0_9HYPH|nr:YihY/virulence factor BrkB family protein [Mesorhizobium microcysteis]TYR34969.1 YihY/virulence factor BrkB family protein [Mesorhizobium microcysteis]
MLRLYVITKRVLGDALGHFNYDDGWALASHLALSALLALFPFLIFATSLASFLGAEAFADTAVHLIFDTWPDAIAEPIAREVANVLTVQRGDFLTIGILAAAFFASNGIEALRVGLNRAYRVLDRRSIFFLRAQSLAFVVIATVGFMIVSALLVVAPVAMGIAQRHLPWIEPYIGTITLWRILIAVVVIVMALIAVHLWLPAGKRKFKEIVPGLIFTLVFWVLGSSLFATYLSYFSTYASTYAGLASIMIALVFLYIVSAIFILGGELNAAIKRYLDARARVTG